MKQIKQAGQNAGARGKERERQMKTYMVRLHEPYHKEIEQEWQAQDIWVTYVSPVLKDRIIIETSQEKEQLRANPLFQSVSEAPIGTLGV